MEKLTIYQIKELTKETSPYYFSPETLRFFGQRMSHFKVIYMPDGRYKITAPVIAEGRVVSHSVRYYNPENHELELK